MKNPTFKVRLVAIDWEREADIELPFVPFVGLNLQIPWMDGDFVPIEEIYWDAKAERFDVYFNEEDVEPK